MQQVTQYDFFVACVDEYIEQKIIAKLFLKGFGVLQIEKMYSDPFKIALHGNTVCPNKTIKQSKILLRNL